MDAPTFKITQVSSDRHIDQILRLQRANLKPALKAEVIAQEGFVTCEHDLELLQKMNQPNQHVIALLEDEVVGYCLVMAPIWRGELEVLKDMFDKIEATVWNGAVIDSSDYVTMGQVCIHKDHRSKGLFKRMYLHYKRQMCDQFKYCITEVACENHRSLNAHAAVGFQPLLSYQAKDGKNWELIIWDWSV